MAAAKIACTQVLAMSVYPTVDLAIARCAKFSGGAPGDIWKWCPSGLVPSAQDAAASRGGDRGGA